MRNSKPSDNVPPDESLSIHIPDVGKGLGFHPLGIVVVRTYVIHLLGIYVIILCNWLIL